MTYGGSMNIFIEQIHQQNSPDGNENLNTKKATQEKYFENSHTHLTSPLVTDVG